MSCEICTWAVGDYCLKHKDRNLTPCRDFRGIGAGLKEKTGYIEYLDDTRATQGREQGEGIKMNDKKQVKLLEDAITLYENGAILEAGDKASEFINTIKQVKLLEDAIALYKDGAILEAGDKASEFIKTIIDFLKEERSKKRRTRWKRSASLNRQ